MPAAFTDRTPMIIGGLCAAALFALYVFSDSSHLAEAEAARVTKAIAILSGPKVTGTVTLSQPTATGATYITGRISGLDGSALRGFHVHEFGDVSQGCMGAGGHFNPYSKDHGGPHDADRHVGDLGNVMSNQGGVVDLSIEDKLVQLNGPLTVLGRAIVIHSGTDDVGRGNNPASKQNGNAGGRDACGIIAVAH